MSVRQYLRLAFLRLEDELEDREEAERREEEIAKGLREYERSGNKGGSHKCCRCGDLVSAGGCEDCGWNAPIEEVPQATPERRAFLKAKREAEAAEVAEREAAVANIAEQVAEAEQAPAETVEQAEARQVAERLAEITGAPRNPAIVLAEYEAALARGEDPEIPFI